MLRQDPRRWLSNPVLHLERLNGARLSAKPPAMGTPVLHLNLGKVPVSVGGAYNSHARKDFEMSLIHGALSQLQPHVYSTGNLTRGRGWESSYQSTWVVVLDESDEGRATRQQVADMGFMTVAVSAASVHLPVSLHPGRIPLSLTRILISDLPVDFYRRGCTSEILECAGYTADKVAVVAEHGGELPGALAAAHPGVLRAGVVVAYVRAPADDPQLRRLPPYFMDRNHPIIITLDIQNNTSSSSANPTTWQRPYRTPAPPPGRPAGAPRQASGPSRAQQETEGSRRAAQAARAAAAAATAAPLARGLAGGGSSALTGAAAPGAMAEGGGARAQSQAGPASLDPLDPGPQGTEPGGRAEALLRNVGWQPGTVLGPDPRKGPAQKVWEVTEQRAPCHKGGLGNIPGPPGLSPDPAENPNSFFVLGEGEAGAVEGGAAEGGEEEGGNRAGGSGGIKPSNPSPNPSPQTKPYLPDDVLVESCERWLEDRCDGGSQTLYWGVIAEAVKAKVIWARFSGGTYSNMPGDAVFRNMLRAAVRGQGVDIDEDEALPQSCLLSQSPPLKASCLLYLENFHAELSEAERETVVAAFEATNGSFFAEYRGAAGVVVKPLSNKFRKLLWQFVKDWGASNSRRGSGPPSAQPLSLCIQAGGPDGAGVVVTLTVAGPDEEMPEARPGSAVAAEAEPMAEAGPASAPRAPDEPMPAAPESGQKRREGREPAAQGSHPAQKSARTGSRDARRSLSRPGTGDPDPIPTPPALRRSSRESRKRDSSDIHSPLWSPNADSRPRGRSTAPKDGAPLA